MPWLRPLPLAVGGIGVLGQGWAGYAGLAKCAIPVGLAGAVELRIKLAQPFMWVFSLQSSHINM